MALEKVRTQDAAWFHFETPEQPMHVASVPIFQLPEGGNENFFAEVKEQIGQRAKLLKNYQVRREETPFGIDHPVWVHVDELDMDYHVQRVVLPAPGNEAQLEKMVARLAAVPMDLDKPLWQYTVIEGLEDNRVAVYIKIHHAVIDGESGVDQLYVTMDTQPVSRRIEAANSNLVRKDAPDAFTLLSDAFTRFALQPMGFMNKMTELASAANVLTQGLLDRLNATANRTMAPATRFNRTVTPLRKFAFASLPLEDMKAVKNEAGATLNDVMLAVTAGALRRYLDSHGELPEDQLVTMCPVSLRRTAANKDEMGTMAAGMLVGLATDIEDPVERLHIIHANAVEAKKDVEVTKDLTLDALNIPGLPLAMRAAGQMFGSLQIADMLRPVANVTVSNVPGPRDTIYLNGARMLHYHPVSMIVHGQGLNITVQSYDGWMDVGLLACRKSVPDLEKLRDYMVDAFLELKEAVLGGEQEELPVYPMAAE